MPNLRQPTVVSVPAILSLMIATAAQAADPKPAAWTPEMMLKAKGVAEPAVSPDGKRVAFSVSTPSLDGEHSEWLSQIYVSTPGAAHPAQLTRGDKSATNPAWSPDGQWIAFLTPRAGPKSNLWRIPING